MADQPVSMVRSPYGPVAVAYSPLRAAALSYDVVADLDPAREATNRIAVTFEGPVIVVGFYPSVRPVNWGSFTASGQFPTTEDILVDWDLFKRTHLTSTETLEPDVGTQQGKGFTTLASLNLTERLIMQSLPAQGNAAPQIGFIFRWRSWGAAVRPPGPVNIRLTVLADPMDDWKGK